MGLRGAGVGAYGGGAEEGLGGARKGTECRLEGRPNHPVMWLSSSGRRQVGHQTRLLGKGLLDLMERTVVRCADGHVFSTASFPMQQAERLGPGRLMRCPRCARMRSVVPVALEKR